MEDAAQLESETLRQCSDLTPSAMLHHPNAAEPLTAVDVAWLLWLKKRLLAKVVLWALIVSVVVAFAIPKRYTAITRLMPPDYRTGAGASLLGALPLTAVAQSARSGGESSSAMSVASQLLGLNTSGDLIVGVFRSQTVEDRMISRFNLLKLYNDKYMQDARRDFEGKTHIEIDKKTGIIGISIEDRSPERASAMARAYVDEVNALFSSVNTSAAHRERVFIEDRLHDIGTELSAAEQEFSVFASQNSAIDIPQQAKATVEGAAQLEAQLVLAQTQLAGLTQVYAPQNARVRALQAQVAELQHQLEKLSGKDVNVSNGSSLGAGELYPSLRQLPLLGVKYLDLYRRNRVDEAVFELLSKQVELARIEEAKDIPSLKVMDPPAVPEKKSFPHRLWIICSAMGIAFLAVATSLVGREVWLRIDPAEPWKVLLVEVYCWARRILLQRKLVARVRLSSTRMRRSAAASSSEQ